MTLEQHAAYWQQHLKDAPALLKLPSDRIRPAIQSRHRASVRLLVPAALRESLAQLADNQRVPLPLALLAGWAVLLSRLSGQQDLVIAAYDHHANAAPLRVRLDNDPSTMELLAQLDASSSAAQQHRTPTFQHIVDALHPQPNASYHPLTQVGFAWNGEGYAREDCWSQDFGFDLALTLTDTTQQLEGRLDYATDLYELATVERLCQNLLQVLASMVADPGQAVSRLACLPPDQRQQLLHDFNDTGSALPSGTIVQLFEARAMAQPDAVALEYQANELSYDTLDRIANQLAHYLLGRKVGAGDRVALCVERGIEMVVGMLAILKAGATYVPLDPLHPPARLAYMLDDAGVSLVLTQSSLAWALPPAIASICLDDLPGRLGGVSDRRPDVAPDMTHAAYITYTSGSTGKPKGVAARQLSVVNYLSFIVRQYGVVPGDKVLQVPTLSFDASVRDILGTLTAGATLCIMSSEQARDPQAIRGQLVDRAITAILSITPSLLAALTAADGDAAEALRLVLVSGEILTARQAAAARRALGRQVRIVNQYGPTECTMTSTFYHVSEAQPVLVGKPIANASIYVLDRHGQPVPIGVTGEIYIGGAGVAAGYLNQPELTAQRFLPDPFHPFGQGRMYRTGDLGCWLADGNLNYIGRDDFQVKIRGVRIEPGEVQAALCELAPVRQAAVVVHADGADGDPQLVAYVVAQPSEALDAVTLRSLLAERLPAPLLPSSFVILEQLPLLVNGKVDRNALPVPGAAAGRGGPPQNIMEKLVADVWRQVLGCDVVGLDDNFFELGGESLRAVRVAAALRKRLGEPVALAGLFDYPTVRRLAAYLDSPTA